MLKMPEFGTVTLKQFAVLFLLFIASVTGAAVVPVQSTLPVCLSSGTIFNWDWLQVWFAVCCGAGIAVLTKAKTLDDRFVHPSVAKALIAVITGISTIAGVIGSSDVPNAAPTFWHLPWATLSAALGGVLFGLVIGFIDDQKRFNRIAESGLKHVPVVGKYIGDTTDIDAKEGAGDESNRTN